MSAAKHTPGPWSTDEADHDAPYQDITICGGRHRRICSVWIDDAPVHDYNAEQKANARLIAAAPELLEALRKAKTASLPTEVRDVVNAAIAKATGGTP